MKTIFSYCMQLIFLCIWKIHFMIIALFEFGVGQISRKYGPHKSSQLGWELPSWLDMDYSHQFRYWQVYFKLSVTQAPQSSKVTYKLSWLEQKIHFMSNTRHKFPQPLNKYKERGGRGPGNVIFTQHLESVPRA